MAEKKKFNTGDVVYHRSNDSIKWVVNESYNDGKFCKVESVMADGKILETAFPAEALTLVLSAGVD